MSGCLDGVQCPHIEVDCGEKRNQIAAVLAGGLVRFLNVLVKVDETSNKTVAMKDMTSS